jgi:hypothetical protein
MRNAIIILYEDLDYVSNAFIVTFNIFAGVMFSHKCIERPIKTQI